MHYQLSTLVPLLLAVGTIAAPLPGKPTAQDSHSLESTPGPYKFKPAPVWRRHGENPPCNSLESCPGPYKFKPAPVWPREAGKEPPPSSLESTPGPYKFKPAPVWRREAQEQASSGSLESTPGPYKLEAAPVGTQGQGQPPCNSLESCPGPYKFDPAPVWPSKKGAGLWAVPHIAEMVKDSGATWAYNWGSNPAEAFAFAGQAVPAGVELVPMVNAPSKADDATLQQIKSSGAKVVLGYNEPDGVIPLADAVSAWTKVTQQLSGLRIGSPAPANLNVNNADDWFVKFMQQTKANGAKVDFICLHHYAKESDVPSAVANFKKFVDSVYDKYKLPIWITEYAMVDYYDADTTKFRVPDAANQEQFVKDSAAMLKSLRYVERFAWFAMPQNDAQPATNLYTQNQDGWQRTQFGAAYKLV